MDSEQRKNTLNAANMIMMACSRCANGKSNSVTHLMWNRPLSVTTFDVLLCVCVCVYKSHPVGRFLRRVCLPGLLCGERLRAVEIGYASPSFLIVIHRQPFEKHIVDTALQ